MVKNTFKSKHRFRALQLWPSWAPLPTLHTKENLVIVAHLQSNLVGAGQEDYCLRPEQATHVCCLKENHQKIQKDTQILSPVSKKPCALCQALRIHLYTQGQQVLGGSRVTGCHWHIWNGHWACYFLPSQDSGGTHPLTPG